MKYYADYMCDTVYAVREDGYTQLKEWIPEDGGIRYGNFKMDSDVPWLSEENGVGFYVKEITGKEYNEFGRSWIFNGDGSHRLL